MPSTALPRLLPNLPLSVIRTLARPGVSSTYLRFLGNGARIDFWNRMGCSFDPQCYLGPLVQVLSGTDVRVGEGTALSGRIELAAWGAISVGQNVMISDAVHLLTGSHDINDPAFTGMIGPITIEDHVWLAQGAVILPGVTVGEGAVVGAYAVVASDVPSRTVVVGNPARAVRKRETFDPTFIPAEYMLAYGGRRP